MTGKSSTSPPLGKAVAVRKDEQRTQRDQKPPKLSRVQFRSTEQAATHSLALETTRVEQEWDHGKPWGEHLLVRSSQIYKGTSSAEAMEFIAPLRRSASSPKG